MMPEQIRIYCKELSPPDVERASLFYETSMQEAKISYSLYITQGILPRQVFLRGYDAMFAEASLYMIKKFKIKVDEHLGSTHSNMRKVLDFLTKEESEHKKLIELYETAVEKFKSLSEQYWTEEYFAKKAVKNLIDEGYNKGKKSNYYSDDLGSRKDPLALTMEEAKEFINNVVEPFLFIMDSLIK